MVHTSGGRSPGRREAGDRMGRGHTGLMMKSWGSESWRRLAMTAACTQLVAVMAALPVAAATETEVHVDLSFQGDCAESGTVGFYVEDVLHHEEAARWSASGRVDVHLIGMVTTDEPEITMRLTSSQRGVVLEAPVRQIEDDPEAYKLDGRVDCDVVPYVLLMPDTATEQVTAGREWFLLGIFAAALSLLFRRQKAAGRA